MVAHSLRGEGFDASEDGTGRGTPLVPCVAPTMDGRAGRSGANSFATSGGLVPVCFDTTQITSTANYSNPQPGDPCHPLASGAHAPAIAFSAQDNGRDISVEVAPTMRKGGDGGGVQLATVSAMQVRRLTPRECERLQGFPDRYTAIPWRTYQEADRKGISYETLLAQRGMTLRGPSIEECPDGPRYKALGNSWAVPNVRWIGERIDLVDQILTERKAA